MASNFSIDIFSDSKYEELTAEISYLGQILCQLNIDKGVDQIEVEFFADMRILSEQVEMRFPLEEFLRVLSSAKDELIKK